MTHPRDRIIALEERFWQSMADKDVDAAKAMIADQCLVTGPNGAMKIDPDTFAEMMKDGKWTLDSFELSDVEVTFPTAETAIIAYTVEEKGEMKGKPMDMRCADASTWVNNDGEWKCTLHTETIMSGAPA